MFLCLCQLCNSWCFYPFQDRRNHKLTQLPSFAAYGVPLADLITGKCTSLPGGTMTRIATGASAAQVRNKCKCGTSVAQVRSKRGESVQQVRSKCGASAEQVRSTVQIACGTPAGVLRRGVIWQKHPKKHTQKHPPQKHKNTKKDEKNNNQLFFSPSGLFAGTRADPLPNGGGTGAAPVRNRCGSRSVATAGAERVRNGCGTGGCGTPAERRRICGAASSAGTGATPKRAIG